MAASPSPAGSDEPLATGSVLDGRYRIEGVLGTGGMGRVYRAAHIAIGKSVAIKVLHATLGRNREASQRFQREALASGRLDHPNIVGVSDFRVLDDGACCLVMELLEGESLGDRLDREQTIGWREAVEILRGVLCGLRHAHERGVVHRDIKPDNVFLARKDGERMIKILDFGIAKLFAGSDDDPASTRAGLTVGTPAYLSPEQAVGGDITPASDLYSSSIVLYEMLAGRAPFEDKDPLAMLGAHVSRRPPAFAVIAPGVEVPRELEAIIQRGLVKAAAERISSADGYLALLEEVVPPVRAISRSTTLPASSALPAPAAGTAAGAARDHRSDRAAPEGLPHAAPAHSDGYGAGPREGLPVVAPLPDPAPASARVAAVASSATAGPLVAAGSQAMASVSRAVVSLSDAGDPIPLTWMIRSAAMTGVVIVAAIALAIGGRCVAASDPATAASSQMPAARSN